MNSEIRKVGGVYGLVDPRTRKVMYVGQAVDIDIRYHQHLAMYDNDNNLQKAEWISGLLRNGMAPTLKTLKICETKMEMNSVEAQEILEHKARGEAELNLSVGGLSRSINKIQNASQEEWYIFAENVHTARGLLLSLASDAGRMASVEHSDAIRKLIRKLDQEVNRIDKRIRRKFPEWDDVSRVLRAAQDPCV